MEKLAHQLSFKNSVAKKLIIYTILFSSLITLLITGLQLYIDYRNSYSELDHRFQEVEIGFLPSLTTSIWYFDNQQASTLVETLSQLPDIAVVDLVTEDLGNISIHHSQYRQNGPSRTFNIVYNNNLTTRQLGKLTVTLTLDSIYARLLNLVFIVFFSNFVKALLVSTFLLFIFNKLVTRPLKDLAASSKRLTIDQLSLLHDRSAKDRVMGASTDELSVMGNAISEMQSNFSQSFQRMKESEQRLRDIISFGFDFIFETNENLEFIFVHADNEQDPIKPYLVVGSNLRILPIAGSYTQTVGNRQEINIQQVEFVHEGQSQFYKMIAKPYYSLKTNEFRGYRGLIENISQTVLEHVELEKQKDQIRQMQKIDALGALTAGIAHDFNNVLAIIYARSQALLENRYDDSRNKMYIKSIFDASDRGSRTLKKLLAFARKTSIESKVFELNSSIVNLQDMIKLAVTKKVVVNYELEPHLWNCQLDEAMFENALLNLCINSRDAMPENGGEITVATRNVEVSESKSLVPVGQYVLLSVEDNGLGMSEKIKARIFEPFFTTKGIGKGTGLGLATVYGFVKQSNGYIFVNSEEGKGTRFDIYLPKYLESAEVVDLPSETIVLQKDLT